MAYCTAGVCVCVTPCWLVAKCNERVCVGDQSLPACGRQASIGMSGTSTSESSESTSVSTSRSTRRTTRRRRSDPARVGANSGERRGHACASPRRTWGHGGCPAHVEPSTPKGFGPVVAARLGYGTSTCTATTRSPWQVPWAKRRRPNPEHKEHAKADSNLRVRWWPPPCDTPRGAFVRVCVLCF